MHSPNFPEPQPPWLKPADNRTEDEEDWQESDEEDWRERDGDLAFDHEREKERA